MIQQTANNITKMLSMLGKEGIICAPSNVRLYACVTMVLDSNVPTCIIALKSMSLKQKQPAQNYFGSGQMYVLSTLIISTTKGGSEHSNFQYILAWMSPCMATFAKRWVIQTSVFFTA